MYLIQTHKTDQNNIKLHVHIVCNVKFWVYVVSSEALFGGPLFALMDIPDDPGLVLLDFLMVTATLVFCVELVVNLMASASYRPTMSKTACVYYITLHYIIHVIYTIMLSYVILYNVTIL